MAQQPWPVPISRMFYFPGISAPVYTRQKRLEDQTFGDFIGARNNGLGLSESRTIAKRWLPSVHVVSGHDRDQMQGCTTYQASRLSNCCSSEGHLFMSATLFKIRRLQRRSLPIFIFSNCLISIEGVSKLVNISQFSALCASSWPPSIFHDTPIDCRCERGCFSSSPWY